MTATQLPIALFFLEMSCMLAACRGVGRIAGRIGQPQVVGEIIAGVMPGPSLFGLFWPQAEHVFYPPDSMKTLYIGARQRAAWQELVLATGHFPMRPRYHAHCCGATTWPKARGRR